jgi:hypothetical protein
MSDFNIHAAMANKDMGLFYDRDYEYTALENHTIRAAPYLDFHDALITYNPNEWVRRDSSLARHVVLDNSNNFEANEMVPTFILDVAKFRTADSDLYAHLERLHTRARAAACNAVTALWIEKAPLQYIDFNRSELSLKDYLAQQHTKGAIK